MLPTTRYRRHKHITEDDDRRPQRQDKHITTKELLKNYISAPTPREATCAARPPALKCHARGLSAPIRLASHDTNARGDSRQISTNISARSNNKPT